jgi:hypothetical protein
MEKTGRGDEAATPPMGFVRSDQAACFTCNGLLPRENVARNINPRTGHQITKMYCEHCKRLCRATRVLVNGDWETRGVEVVTDPKEVAGFLARLDLLKGNRVVEPMDDINDGGESNAAQFSSDSA